MSQNSSKISLSKKGKSLIINNNTDKEFEYRGFESRPLRLYNPDDQSGGNITANFQTAMLS